MAGNKAIIMACCPPNSHGYLASTRDHKGAEITVFGGVEAYSVGALGQSERAILICPDIWGWDSGRLRNVADHLAEAGYLVVVPKILQPPYVMTNTHNCVAPTILQA
jgi:dienelactone hydrolase